MRCLAAITLRTTAEFKEAMKDPHLASQEQEEYEERPGLTV